MAEQSGPRSEPRVSRRRFSPLMRRILFLNMAPLMLLVAGLLYLDDYRRTLIAGEFAALGTQAQVFAAAIAETAIIYDRDGDGVADPPADDSTGESLARDPAQQLVRRLAEPTHARARLFGPDGALIADSRVLGASGFSVEIAPLAPLGPPPDTATEIVNTLYDFVMNWLPARADVPPEAQGLRVNLGDYPEAEAAQRGEVATILRALPVERRVVPTRQPQLSLSVAAPVQRFKQVLGVLMLTADSGAIEANLRAVRVDVLKVFLFVLGVTVLVSFYLGRTIAQPVRRLALAAERIRRGGQFAGVGSRAMGSLGGRPAIPDFSHRDDEIGDLSLALIEMIDALWRRLDAIERFAADVAHEIKNPLTSLKSAVETAARINDADHRQKLLNVILDDVARLDRLIADISDASRLDAELSREEMEQVDISNLLQTLIELHEAAGVTGGARMVFERSSPGPLVTPGVEDRLGQVFRNLIANAVSFSPPDGLIKLTAARKAGMVEVTVDDEGPGMPEDKKEKIFDRFYSDRPEGEKFGGHSGLGLSISRQIVSAHGGTIKAENRKDAAGRVLGARFVIKLPLA